MSQVDPLTVQVAGDHYKKLAIQPMVFATANRYDPCAFSILKYVTRWRDKGGVQDLKKAFHIARMRQAPSIGDWLPVNRFSQIGMAEYVRANNLPNAESQILLALDSWVFSTGLPHAGAEADKVISQLETLIAQQEGCPNG